MEKVSFFKTLCGYSLLTEGQVIYRGKIIGKEQDFIDDAGIVIEEPEFINSLSGLENLKILAEIQKKISEAEIIEVLKQFDLYEDRNKKGWKIFCRNEAEVKTCAGSDGKAAGVDFRRADERTG